MSKGKIGFRMYAMLLKRIQHMVVECSHIAHMVKVEHQETCRSHELGTARAERLGALSLALLQIFLILGLVEHAHIGQCRQLGLAILLPCAMTENEFLGLLALGEGHKLLSIARLQQFIE